NLDRLVIRRLEINGGAAISSHTKKKKKDRCPRSHGAPERYRRAKVLQRRKGPSRTGVCCVPGKQGRAELRGLLARQAQSQCARLLVETTSEHQCVRIDRWLRRCWQRSGFERLGGGDELPEDGSTHAFTERDLW